MNCDIEDNPASTINSGNDNEDVKHDHTYNEPDDCVIISSDYDKIATISKLTEMVSSRQVPLPRISSISSVSPCYDLHQSPADQNPRWVETSLKRKKKKYPARARRPHPGLTLWDQLRNLPGLTVSDIQNSIVCHYCGVVLDKTQLREHLDMEHSNLLLSSDFAIHNQLIFPSSPIENSSQRSNPVNEAQPVATPNASEAQLVKCPLCNFAGPGVGVLQIHVETYHCSEFASAGDNIELRAITQKKETLPSINNIESAASWAPLMPTDIDQVFRPMPQTTTINHEQPVVNDVTMNSTNCPWNQTDKKTRLADVVDSVLSKPLSEQDRIRLVMTKGYSKTFAASVAAAAKPVVNPPVDSPKPFFTCHICGYRTTVFNWLRCHLTLRHPPTPRPLQRVEEVVSSIASRPWSYEASLALLKKTSRWRSAKSAKQPNLVVPRISTWKPTTAQSRLKSTTYSCTQCSFVAPTYASWKLHVDNHHVMHSVLKHAYKCCCGFRAESIKGLTVHTNFCSYSIGRTCEHCNFATSSVIQLKMHMDIEHNQFIHDNTDTLTSHFGDTTTALRPIKTEIVDELDRPIKLEPAEPDPIENQPPLLAFTVKAEVMDSEEGEPTNCNLAVSSCETTTLSTPGDRSNETNQDDTAVNSTQCNGEEQNLQCLVKNVEELIDSITSGSHDGVCQPPKVKPSLICIICHCDLAQGDNDDNSAVALACGHVFHVDCLKSWTKIKATCPKCRVYVDSKRLGSQLFFDRVAEEEDYETADDDDGDEKATSVGQTSYQSHREQKAGPRKDCGGPSAQRWTPNRSGTGQQQATPESSPFSDFASIGSTIAIGALAGAVVWGLGSFLSNKKRR